MHVADGPLVLVNNFDQADAVDIIERNRLLVEKHGLFGFADRHKAQPFALHKRKRCAQVVGDVAHVVDEPVPFFEHVVDG